MNNRKNKMIALIAMIPLIIVLGSANAASTTGKSDVFQPIVQQNKSDAKVIVLAKGQNNLPKHERTDCPA